MRHISAGWIEAHDGGWRVYSSVKARPPSSEREREEVGLDKRAIGSGFQPLTIPSTVGGGRKRLLAGVEKNSGGNSVNPSVGFNRLRRTQSSIMGREGRKNRTSRNIAGEWRKWWRYAEGSLFFFFTRVVRCSLRGDEWEGDKGKR